MIEKIDFDYPSELRAENAGVSPARRPPTSEMLERLNAMASEVRRLVKEDAPFAEGIMSSGGEPRLYVTQFLAQRALAGGVMNSHGQINGVTVHVYGADTSFGYTVRARIHYND